MFTPMGPWVLALAMLLTGCKITQSAKTIQAKPDIQTNGKNRAIRVTIDPSVNDYYPLYRTFLNVSEWRRILGNALAYALRDSFVLVNESGPQVLELRIGKAIPRAVQRGNTIFAQIDFAVRLELPSGDVLARTATVIEGPISVAEDASSLDPMVTSAVEAFVRAVAQNSFDLIPTDFPANETLTRVAQWVDFQPEKPKVSLPPEPKPVRSAKAHKCIAAELPEWETASAEEKGLLLQECR